MSHLRPFLTGFPLLSAIACRPFPLNEELIWGYALDNDAPFPEEFALGDTTFSDNLHVNRSYVSREFDESTTEAFWSAIEVQASVPPDLDIQGTYVLLDAVEDGVDTGLGSFVQLSRVGFSRGTKEALVVLRRYDYARGINKDRDFLIQVDVTLLFEFDGQRWSPDPATRSELIYEGTWWLYESTSTTGAGTSQQ